MLLCVVGAAFFLWVLRLVAHQVRTVNSLIVSRRREGRRPKFTGGYCRVLAPHHRDMLGYM
jgi:hypothetical protein